MKPFEKCLIFFFALILAGCPRSQKSTVESGPHLASLFESTKNIQDAQIDPKKFSDKLLIVNFWASWCGPCMEETPALLKFISENKTQVFLISISEDESRKEMKKFIELFPAARSENIFVVHDVDRNWSQNFSVFQFPETFIFNKQRRLVKKFEGSIPFQDPNIKKMILDFYQEN